MQTARLLTDGPVGTEPGFREQVRAGWIEDMRLVVDRAFARPSVSAHEGWVSLEGCRTRVVRAVARIRDAHRGRDVVLVGHGTAWTLLLADAAGVDPEPIALRQMAFPALFVL